MDYTSSFDQIIFLLKSICVGLGFISAFVVMKFIIHAKNQKHLFIFAFFFLSFSSFAEVAYSSLNSTSAFSYLASGDAAVGVVDWGIYKVYSDNSTSFVDSVSSDSWTGTRETAFTYFESLRNGNPPSAVVSACSTLNSTNSDSSFYYAGGFEFTVDAKSSGGSGSGSGSGTGSGTGTGQDGTGDDEQGTGTGDDSGSGSGDDSGSGSGDDSGSGSGDDSGNGNESGETDGSGDTIYNYETTNNYNTYNQGDSYKYVTPGSLPSMPDLNGFTMSGTSIDQLRLKLAVNLRQYFTGSGETVIVVPFSVGSFHFDQTINLVPTSGPALTLRYAIRCLFTCLFCVAFVLGIVKVLRQY